MTECTCSRVGLRSRRPYGTHRTGPAHAGGNYIYYGDAAQAPYGEKTTEQVRALTLDRAKLLMEDCQSKALVVACNTATSAAIHQLRRLYPDRPVIA